MRFQIDYYRTTSGRIPVKEFIEDLNLIDQVKIGRVLDLLGEYNFNVRTQYFKKAQKINRTDLEIARERKNNL